VDRLQALYHWGILFGLRHLSGIIIQGREEVLSGYIFALRGDCPESKAMFNKALTINPAVYLPEKYRKICE
jgi:hypothetical protein